MKKSVYLKFEITSITSRYHVSAVEFIVYFVLACKKSNLGGALLFQVKSSSFLKSRGCIREQQFCLRMKSQIDLLRSSIEEKVQLYFVAVVE